MLPPPPAVASTLSFPDRALTVRPPGKGIASRLWTLLVALFLAAGALVLVIPPIGDLVNDFDLVAKARPVPGAQVEGRCSVHGGVLTRCDATLSAAGHRRKVDYFFVDFHTGSYAVDLRGATPGVGTALDTGFDQTIVTGTVALGSATLTIDSNGFAPAVGDKLLILDNDTNSDPIVGTFNSLPEGSTPVSSDGQTFKVSYVGGDGNDITLERVAAATIRYVDDAWAGFSVSDSSVAACGAGERLVGAWHAVGFYTSGPPDTDLVRGVFASRQVRGGRVVVTARNGTFLGSVRAVVQVGAVCAGAA